MVLEASAPLKGAYAASIPNSGSTYLQEDVSATDELFVSFYLRVDSAPASTVQIAQISNGGTVVGNLRLTPSRHLRLYNDTTQIGSDSASALMLGTVYRVGLHQKKGSGNGILEAYVVEGDDPFSPTPFASSAALTLATQAARLKVGTPTADAAAITLDDIKLDREIMPPPSTAPLPLQAGVKLHAAMGYPQSIESSLLSMADGDLE